MLRKLETESKEIENESSSVSLHLPGIDAQTEKKEPAVLSPIMSNNSLQMLRETAGSFLKNNDIASLSRTNKAMHGLFKEPLIKARKVTVKKLLQHVVDGEEKEADRLLKKYPHLLQYADTITDYAGRRIYGTAYQIALGAEDEYMLAMLQWHFSRLENGREAMQAQQAAQFPAAEEKAWELRKSQDKKELHRVIQALAAAPNEEACAQAIQAFHAYMDKPRGDEQGIIRTGRHFNAQLLLKAFKLYAMHYRQFGGSHSWKSHCFWRQVIGYIQRHLPACYAQAFCQGILTIVKNSKAFRRSFKLRYNAKISFFPPDSNADFRLGYDYALGPRFEGGDGGMVPPMNSNVAFIFQDFCQIKAKNLHQLVGRPTATSSTRLHHSVR